MNMDKLYKEILCKTKYVILFITSLIALASCQKSIIQSYTPTTTPQDYTGTWEYEVWTEDSTDQKEYFGLFLQNTDNDSVKGLFYSAFALEYEDVHDGNECVALSSIQDLREVGEDVNVLGKVVNDSLYVTLKGCYRENTSATAVIYLENDSSLLWKVNAKEGEIYLPDSVILKRVTEEVQDSIKEEVQDEPFYLELKGKLSGYSVDVVDQPELYEEDKPMGYISISKNGETISKIDLPCYISNSNGDFFVLPPNATSKGFNLIIHYGHAHLRYIQIFVIEYINNEFCLVKIINYTPNSLIPYGKQGKSENKLKEPIPFSKVNIEKMMLIGKRSN